MGQSSKFKGGRGGDGGRAQEGGGLAVDEYNDDGTSGHIIPVHYESNIEDIHETWDKAMTTMLDKPYDETTKKLEKLKQKGDRHPDLYERIQRDREQRQAEKLARRERRFNALYRRNTSSHNHDSTRDLKIVIDDGGVGVGGSIPAVNADDRAKSDGGEAGDFLGGSGNNDGAVPLLLEDSPEVQGISRGKPSLEASLEIKKRYGKWVSRLEKDPDLSKLLHRVGSEGQQFGYEPLTVS